MSLTVRLFKVFSTWKIHFNRVLRIADVGVSVSGYILQPKYFLIFVNVSLEKKLPRWNTLRLRWSPQIKLKQIKNEEDSSFCFSVSMSEDSWTRSTMKFNENAVIGESQGDLNEVEMIKTSFNDISKFQLHPWDAMAAPSRFRFLYNF